MKNINIDPNQSLVFVTAVVVNICLATQTVKMCFHHIGTNTINKTYIGGPHAYTPLIGAIVKNNPKAVQILSLFDKIDVDGNKYTYNHNNYTALEHAVVFGNDAALRILLRTLLKQRKVSDWSSLAKTGIGERIQKLAKIANKRTKHSKYTNPCLKLLNDLIMIGLENMNYGYVASTLRYNIPTLVKSSNGKFVLPNETVMVGNNYPCQDWKAASTVVERWHVGEVLGRGSFGDVLKGTDINDEREVALKYISTNKLSENSKSRATRIVSFIMNELETMELIDHQNVIKLFAYNLNVDNNGTMLLVFEYAQNGELYQFLAINRYFNDDIAKTYFEQILDALETCHLMGIIHRDLKPQNILLDSKYQAKVADFGLSTFDNDLASKNVLHVGTRGYMSPEITSPMIDDYDDETDEPIYKEITPACDVFSLGVILWELLNGIKSMPFEQAMESDPKYVYITQNHYDLFWKCHHNCRIVKKSSNQDVQHLLLQMFTFLPKRRIGINDIRKHKWYRNTKGYNQSEKSRLFFQETMAEIHKQLKLQQVKEVEARSKHVSGVVAMSGDHGSSQAKATTFEWIRLRFVSPTMMHLCLNLLCVCLVFIFIEIAFFVKFQHTT